MGHGMGHAGGRASDGGPPRYGVVDTTFSVINMGDIAERALKEQGVGIGQIVRRTVPGFKDLPVACKQMIERDGCDVVVACGMPGPEPIDKQCAHEASLGLQQAMLMTSTHILEVFVHMDEADDPSTLLAITDNRTAEHAVNAYWLMERPQELRRRAGTGQRQGFADVGPLQVPGPTSPGHGAAAGGGGGGPVGGH